MKNLIKVCAVVCALALGLTSCQQDVVPPVLTITGGSQIMIEPDGGDITFNYEVTNPVENAVVTLEIPEAIDWITNPIINQEAGIVTITVAENENKESREELVILRYAYSDQSVTAAVSILQKESTYDMIAEMQHVRSDFYGTSFVGNPPLNYYCLTMSGASSTATYVYTIKLYTITESEDRLPVPGTYTIKPEMEYDDFTSSEFNYCYIDEGSGEMGIGIISGTIVVEKEGSVYNITAEMIDEYEKSHLVTYTGEVEGHDMTIISSLTEDIVVDMSGCHIDAINYGDEDGLGLNSWWITIRSGKYIDGEGFLFLRVYTPMEVTAATGGFNQFLMFTESTESDYFFVQGGPYCNPSWYMTVDHYEYDDEYGYMTHVGNPSGPIMRGIMLFITEGDDIENPTGMSISFEVYDDGGHKMNFTGNGLTVTSTDMF